MKKTIFFEVFLRVPSLGGGKLRDTIDVEVEDEASDEEIEAAKEKAAREWLFDEVNWGIEDPSEDDDE